MKKKKLYILLYISCMFILCACGKKESSNANEVNQTAGSNKQEGSFYEDIYSNEEAESNEEMENTCQETPGSLVNTTEDSTENSTQEEKSDQVTSDESDDEFSFKDIENRTFTFSSGVGAWFTELTIDKDGNFVGHYQDCDMGDSGDEYPNGTEYICTFSGKFSEPLKVNEYTYEFQLQYITQEEKDNEVTITDGIRYIGSMPYGIYGGKTFDIFLPGTALEVLPQEYVDWIYINENSTRLPFYGLYNTDMGNGFSSEDYTEYEQEGEAESTDDILWESIADDMKEVLNGKSVKEQMELIQKKADDIDDKLYNESCDQMTMNILSGQQAQLWDDELNRIWAKLKDTLDTEEMEKLRVEEKAWIESKEKQVEEAGAEFEGGTLQSLIVNSKSSELTRERVYELAEYLE